MGALGRGTDSRAAHVTPGEMVIPKEILDNQPNLMSAIIKAFQGFSENVRPVEWRSYLVGDSTTPKNPATGAEEFGIGGVGGADSRAVGLDDRDKQIGMQGGRKALGARGVNPGTVGQATAGDVSSIGATGPSKQVGTIGGTKAVGVAPESESEGFLSGLIPDPQSQTFAPGVMSMVPGAGAFFEGMSELRDYATAQGWDVRDASQGAFNSINEGRASPDNADRARARYVSQFSPAQQEAITENFARPTAMEPPGHLGLSGAMTPLQQRTAIATGATQGESVYRSQDATDYYKNILQRSLIGAGGELGDYNQIMPIESQYLRSVLGLSYRPQPCRCWRQSRPRKERE